MRKVLSFVFIAVLATEALILGQGGDAAKVLAAAREALGGERKLAAVTSVTATGQNSRSNGQASTSGEFEMALVLPDKYMRKDVMGNINGQNLARTSGFNGDGLVEAMDLPQMGGSGMVQVFRSGGPGGVTSFGPGAAAPTPEQKAEIQKAGVLSAKQDFARMTLGMFVTSFDTYPLQFTYAGTAESPDGKADIIEVKGAGEFAAKLFVDQKSHLPLMLSWMAKEPISLSSTSRGGGGQTSSLGGGANVTTFGAGQARPNITPEELQQQLKDAQAKAKVVEYRMFYSEYQNVDGIKLPTKFSRAIDGKASEELTIEKYKLNSKVDPKKFDVAK